MADSLVDQLLSGFCAQQLTAMPHPEELAKKVMNLEEHQMFLERQVEQLSTEVLELSRLLQVAQAELRRLETSIGERKDRGSPEGNTGSSSDEQA